MSEEKKIDLKDRMLSDDALGQVSGGTDQQNSCVCPVCGGTLNLVYGGAYSPVVWQCQNQTCGYIIR